MRIGRVQPPVGYRVSLADVARAAWAGAVPDGPSPKVFLHELSAILGTRHAYGLSSGKAALTTVLQALHALSGRTKVILPAYTCYSVPSAIVKAGLEPVPCDIARGSFDYDYEQLAGKLDSDVLCALSVHLFGIPSNTRLLGDLCRPLGIYIVEDAAQALGVMDEGKWLGTRGDVGFFSLGRGKNITSGAGGIVVTGSDEIACALTAIVRTLPVPGARDDLSTFLSMALLSIFVSPSLYWFPAGLPFLRLGETVFHEDFPIACLSRFQTELLRDWPAQLTRLNGFRLEAAAFYLGHIEGARSYGTSVPYLRFPLLVGDLERRRALLAEGQGRRRLGISWMYPASIGAIPELANRLTEKAFPEAEHVASSLVTLPTHPLLSKDDLTQIAGLASIAMRGTNATLAGPSRLR